METLKLLASLGLPAAMVGMVLIAIVLRPVDKTVSKWAAWIAVGLAAVLGVGQLVSALRGSDFTLAVEPRSVYAFTPAGQPVDLRITAIRYGTVVASIDIPKQSADFFESRPLTLEATKDGLQVKHQDYRVGVLSRERLRDMGWRPSEELTPASGGKAKYWYTYRVGVGDEPLPLGDSPYGVLKIQAKEFTGAGEAVVTLILEGHEAPLPSELRIPNKSVGTQSFSGIPEFYIAVREADFGAKDPWAAFCVFSIQ